MVSDHDRAQQMLARGAYADGIALLGRAAQAGDGQALLALGIERVDGALIRRDLARARRLFALAARAGQVQAALYLTYFIAAGIGGARDWPGARRTIDKLAAHSPEAAEQNALLACMDLTETGEPARMLPVQTLSASPRVGTAAALLSAAECAYLRAQAEPRLEPSLVVDPSSRRMVPHPIRRSDGTMFGLLHEDLVVQAINRRIGALSGTPPEQGEPLQLLRYGVGGEYRAHSDALPGEPNQRIATVLVYLNEGYEGGETRFFDADLSFKGAPGDALLFRNTLPDGRPDPSTRHAGLPVRAGEKLILSRWIRARPFAFPPPTPATGASFDAAPF